jgi:cytochrome P450
MADSASPELRAFYREQRASRPVQYDERTNSFLVYRYADARRVLHDWKSFSSDHDTYLPGSGFARVFARTMVVADPPRHKDLRDLIARAFTARSVEELAPRIADAVRRLIGEFKARGTCEIVEDFAGHVPAVALADFLGIPASRHTYFRRLLLDISRNAEAILSGQPSDMRANEDLERYFTELLEERRRDPRDDLISRLLAAEVNGQRLTQDEVVKFCELVLIAGIGTAARLIALAVRTLIEHPDAVARLRADPGLVPQAVEEVLRFRPPINFWVRVSAEEVEIAGTHIPARARLLPVIGSANRDETVFADPDRFDILRAPNPHLAFSNGIHACVGAPLARLEAKIALTALLDELTDIEFAGDGPPEALPGSQANGLVSLPIRFRARA